MILSHRHRYIFLKTRKTAGTSIEVSLSRTCGPDDIMTPLEPAADEALRAAFGSGPRNFQGSPFSPFTVNTTLRRLARRQWPTRERFWNHMTATTIRRRIPAATWDQYLKFSVVRNPWERALSQYHWRREARNTDVDLDHFLRRTFSGDANTKIFMIDGVIVADRIIAYEHLEHGLAAVMDEIGLPTGDPLPRAKAGRRPDPRPYWDVLTDEQAAVIADKSAAEIRMFGYEFGRREPAIETVATSRWWHDTSSTAAA